MNHSVSETAVFPGVMSRVSSLRAQMNIEYCPAAVALTDGEAEPAQFNA